MSEFSYVMSQALLPLLGSGDAALIYNATCADRYASSDY